MSSLATRFGLAHTLRSNNPLTDGEIQRVAPSIFADHKHESRSKRYAYIPTVEILNALRQEGFQPFMVTQARVREDSREGFAKHMIRLRHAGQIESPEEVNEIVLLNSHDGTSSYQMLAGCFRYICGNGMVCGESYQDIRVRHVGHVVDNVIEGAYSVLENFERIDASKADMKALTLTEDEQLAFAKAAIPLRFEEDQSPPSAASVNQARRFADAKDDLWTLLNRVQENLIKGGIPKLNRRGQVKRTRKINGIDGDIRLNKALWTLAEEMKNLKGG